MIRRSCWWRIGAACSAVLAATLVMSPVAQADPETSGTSYGQDGGCSVYANGSGMGSYCISGGGGGTLPSLSERFHGMYFQSCRYENPIAGMEPDYDLDDEGAWWMRTCMKDIDWDSYSGGPDRQISVSVVWLPPSFNTVYRDTPLSQFLWSTVQTTYPVPSLQMKPTFIPRVGVPAYVTFEWRNTDTHKIVAQGPYADNPQGGPYVESTPPGSDLTMRARATEVTVDPRVEGMEPKTCNPNPAYDTAVPVDEQASDCYLRFFRSSADAADETKDDGIPNDTPYTFFIRVIVKWNVTYGRNGNFGKTLGDFDMVVFQPIPVREVQALNLPAYSVF